MSQATTRVLIVEDDPNIGLGLQELLRSEGYATTLCPRGDQAAELARRESPGLIILDVMLPGVSGFDVCRLLREQEVAVPILMLTAKGQELDKVIGLGAGADDYVTKPFGVQELLARIQALLRRAARAPATEAPDAPFTIGRARIDPRSFHLERDGERHELKARELKLLQFMHAHADEVLSRDRLLSEVWGYNYFGTTRTLDQVIVQLRKKLGDAAHEPHHLLTVHGVGYRLRR